MISVEKAWGVFVPNAQTSYFLGGKGIERNDRINQTSSLLFPHVCKWVKCIQLLRLSCPTFLPKGNASFTRQDHFQRPRSWIRVFAALELDSRFSEGMYSESPPPFFLFDILDLKLPILFLIYPVSAKVPSWGSGYCSLRDQGSSRRPHQAKVRVLLFFLLSFTNFYPFKAFWQPDLINRIVHFPESSRLEVGIILTI